MSFHRKQVPEFHPPGFKKVAAGCNQLLPGLLSGRSWSQSPHGHGLVAMGSKARLGLGAPALECPRGGTGSGSWNAMGFMTKKPSSKWDSTSHLQKKCDIFTDEYYWILWNHTIIIPLFINWILHRPPKTGPCHAKGGGSSGGSFPGLKWSPFASTVAAFSSFQKIGICRWRGLRMFTQLSKHVMFPTGQ